MAANAIDNDNLKNYRDDLGTSGFTPAMDYTYDGTAKEVDVTDQSTYPAGVALKVAHITVHDKFGGQVNGTITPPGDSASGDDSETTIDVSDLDPSKGLDIKAIIVTDDGNEVGLNLVADGIATCIGASGSLGGWDAQRNANFPVA